ncbi:MAG: DUF2892 domain-containing protein [Hyphomicrobiaceae bacterium]|nr:DUF2892 domain-containing protein [Hyphomicrobiaceae bacterium]
MAKNIGTVDRILRVIVGIGLIAFALAGPAEIAWKWIGWIGIVPLVTAAIGSCPLYSLIGLSTCPVKSNA